MLNPLSNGLGLSISRKVSRALGGDLIVQENSGKGAIFTLTMTCNELKTQKRSSKQLQQDKYQDTKRVARDFLQEDKTDSKESTSKCQKQDSSDRTNSESLQLMTKLTQTQVSNETKNSHEIKIKGKILVADDQDFILKFHKIQMIELNLDQNCEYLSDG